MDFKLESIIPIESLRENLDEVLNTVELNGKVALLENNRPKYVILKYEIANSMDLDDKKVKKSKYTLQEAMKLVLLEAPEKTMHAAMLAEEIFQRGLYLKRDGTKAEYNQVRARCSHYPKMFETKSGNFIVLR